MPIAPDPGAVAPGGSGGTGTPAPPLVVSSQLATSGLTLSASSTANGGTAPLSVVWNFGDGASASTLAAAHTYAAAGTYVVRLTVSDAAGNSESVSQTVTVATPVAPVPPLTLSASLSTNALVLTGSAVATGGTGPYTYAWNFGDSTSASGASQSHTFSAAGTYTVTCTATDSASRTAVASQTVTVTVTPVSVPSVTAVVSPKFLTVSASSAITGGTGPFTYAWDFGDGNSSTLAAPSHSYTNGGTYTVALTVTDSASHTATASQQVTVAPAPPPLVAATALSTAYLVLTAANVVTGGTAPYSYSWAFGDGSTSVAPNPTHSYAAAGSYQVTLTVTDSLGVTASSTQTVSAVPVPTGISVPVTPIPASIASFQGDIITRARLELGDQGRAFSSVFQNTGGIASFTLPVKPVDYNTLTVTSTAVAGSLSAGVDYSLDYQNGIITLYGSALTTPATLTVNGTGYRYFVDNDWLTFVNTALLQHLHGTSQDVTSISPVEYYPIAILAVCEALWALLTDASFDIDVTTPEGVTIPRHQRQQQLQELLSMRQDQYNKLASALNVGLNRIEMFDLRRTSRITERLVPVYLPQEYQDSRPPFQVFPNIDTHSTAGTMEPLVGDVQSVKTVNLLAEAFHNFSYNLEGLGNLTGLQVRAQIRAYPAAYQPLAYFKLVVTDLVNGNVTITLDNTVSYYVGYQKFWDLQTVDSLGNVSTLVQGTFNSVRQGNG